MDKGFGERLVALRQGRGYSQERIAMRLCDSPEESTRVTEQGEDVDVQSLRAGDVADVRF